jgi:hypothetical protein
MNDETVYQLTKQAVMQVNHLCLLDSPTYTGPIHTMGRFSLSPFFLGHIRSDSTHCADFFMRQDSSQVVRCLSGCRSCHIGSINFFCCKWLRA